MNKGKAYEDIACEYLNSLGYKILARNFHCRFSEIDILALDGDTLVVVEVKGAKDERFGNPAERFGKKKMQRLLRCAYLYMERENLSCELRIDLITVLRGRVNHYKGVSFD